MSLADGAIVKPLHDQAMDIIIKAAKVRRDDLQHMATDGNKGKQEAALVTAAIEYIESECASKY